MNILIDFRKSVVRLHVWQLFVLALIPSAIGGFVGYNFDLESWRSLMQGSVSLLLLSFLVSSVQFKGSTTSVKGRNDLLAMLFLGMLSYFIVIIIWSGMKVFIWNFDMDLFRSLYPYYYIINSCDCEAGHVDLAFYIFAVILIPIGEEVFHRRMILSKMLEGHGKAYSLMISSLLFSILHPDHPFPAFLFGVALGWTFMKTGNLLYVIAMHSGINIIAFGINRITMYQWIKDMENFSSLSNWTWEIAFGLISLLLGWWIARRMGLLTSSDRGSSKVRGI